jgi:hypothetical protein
VNGVKTKDVSTSLIKEAMEASKREPAPEPVFAFGMHKGGSTMLSDFFQIYTGLVKINSISISNLLFHHGISDDDYRKNHLIGDVLNEKFVFFGYRYVPDFMLANKAHYLNRRAVILVRDPRDCVVSAYYSFLKSHTISSNENSDAAKNIQMERDKFVDASIDEYALSETHRFVDELCGYAYFMHENAMICRYEDIIFDKRTFFTKALQHLNLPLVESALDTALSRVDVVPDKEQSDKHIRSVKPGNHREKLSKETIMSLNKKYSDILSLYGYET